MLFCHGVRVPLLLSDFPCFRRRVAAIFLFSRLRMLFESRKLLHSFVAKLCQEAKRECKRKIVLCDKVLLLITDLKEKQTYIWVSFQFVDKLEQNRVLEIRTKIATANKSENKK